MVDDAIATVKRELLVRCLDGWTPAALHRSRRATFVQGYAAGAGTGAAPEAALRVFTEFADRLRGRRLTTVVIAPDPAGIAARLATVQAPPELGVVTVDGGYDERLAVALKAAGAAGAPVLGYLDAGGGPLPEPATTAALAAGRPAEALLVAGADRVADLDGHRAVLRDNGLSLVTGVELVAVSGAAELVLFATDSAKRLEAFKNELWAVDEYAGVRYRDPRDPERHLIDISLTPHPGPLRRELLARLSAAGGCTVTELRTFTLTETVYRAADANRALTALLAAGAVVRDPEHGRLGGDVVISLPGSAG